MDLEYLVLWEVAQKQNYIFSSNRLRENIGGSIIIEDIVESLPKRLDPNYGRALVYNGGGTSLYRFKTEREARLFIGTISRQVLQIYPGIELFTAYSSYRRGGERVVDLIDRLHRDLEIKKNRRKYSGQQISFGLEKICDSTGYPAFTLESFDGEKGRYLSEEAFVKVRASKNHSRKFKELIPGGVISNSFDNLVNKGKQYIAIVHIDGNKMGLKFNSLREYFRFEGSDYREVNEAYIEALKNFSIRINKLFQEAFKYMTMVINREENRLRLGKITRLDQGHFPLIPIIVAGDDITYVVNGQIGIESARLFLDYLSKREITIYGDEKTTINACAGIAIVPRTYPFSKAYRLAEDLCEEAKKKLREDYGYSGDYSLMDWHIDQKDIYGSVEEIRQEFYRSKDGRTLNIRPLYVNNSEKWNNIQNFRELFKRLYGGRNPIVRSKLEELKEAMRVGSKATEVYIKSNNLEAYFKRPLEDYNLGNLGFTEDRYIFYDLIESIDMYVQLME